LSFKVFVESRTMSSLPNFGLPEGYLSRANPSFDDLGSLESRPFVWQPDVYSLAFLLGRLLKLGTIIDVGCGRGGKLLEVADEFAVIGIDRADNAVWCKENLSFGDWVAADLEQCHEELAPEHVLSSAVIVCADVVEHLVDPAPLMRTIARWLRHCPVAVLSTPDRALNRGESDLGPPANPKHVREWQIDEFKSLLLSQGLQAWVGLTRENTKTNLYRTIVAVVTRRPGQPEV
jgi:SAM-dependent methyltransferase